MAAGSQSGKHERTVTPWHRILVHRCGGRSMRVQSRPMLRHRFHNPSLFHRLWHLRMRFFAVCDPVRAEREVFSLLGPPAKGEVYLTSSGTERLHDVLKGVEQQLIRRYGQPVKYETYEGCSNIANMFSEYEVTMAEAPKRHDLKCGGCSYTFSAKSALRRHKCKGVDSKTCPRCRKSFASNDSKRNHVQHVKCSPASPPPAPAAPTVTINNTCGIDTMTALRAQMEGLQLMMEQLQRDNISTVI